ncbi:hypothetical protein SOASR030_21050 [Leminorella grimontii]|uniref:Sel1 repeat family protein n=1 Tax=Leminorella grimontii TaxID=82981 RepID=A0AAV5N1M3_9GAMM|nr:hypothetical protein [Leminorella grimontii]KFC96846.1 hypothetical protein GLGR_0845 [Leminorella grimontii ATCC 33999 = DSM 5078]GKX55993.1 hypothetical protein SOASR030_21050 [Leminorella grimontii]
MYKFLIIFFILSGAVSAQDKLEDFNHSPKWADSAGRINPDTGLLKYFQNEKFVCQNESEFTPKETPAAAKAFSDFIQYASKGDQIEGFWGDAKHRQQREDLLVAAVKAGSWKATYVNSVWAIKYPSAETPADVAATRLRELVAKGIPIAAYKYATYLYGRDDMAMYYLLAEAVKRGSPEAMSLVGRTIVIRAQELHPLGKRLLECAIEQGDANAYNHLGVLADMEGRRLDAYRLWEKGVNAGCEECIVKMSNLAQVRQGYGVNVPMMELMPELTAIKAFYENNFFYELTELSDFRRSLPDGMAFHMKDAELLDLLRLEKRFRQQP